MASGVPDARDTETGLGGVPSRTIVELSARLLPGRPSDQKVASGRPVIFLSTPSEGTISRIHADGFQFLFALPALS